VFNTLVLILLVIVAASLACIAVALWGIMFTIKKLVILLEAVFGAIVKGFNRVGNKLNL
jgi:hypothetical protein